ncbi:hypothetical protein HYU93_03415 [Candidatus Daviesbacteria bacterium]|nr:hypothetical protein [Candidatus Daviesbacteria bacterium]
MASVVLGVFTHRDRASGAVSGLEAEGYNPKDISIIMRDRGAEEKLAAETGAENVVGGTLGGAAAGAVVGGIAGLVTFFVIPGLGAFFIGGPIAAVLGLSGAAATTASGAATGALAGGLIGALASTFGLSQEDAAIYEGHIKEGDILIAIPAREGEEQEVENILKDFDADNIKSVESREEFTRREEPYREYGPVHLSGIRHRGGSKRSKRSGR